MLQYRINRPNDRPSNKNIDGFTNVSYSPRPISVGRSESHKLPDATPVQINEGSVVEAASNYAKSLIEIDNETKSALIPGVEINRKIFGLAQEKSDTEITDLKNESSLGKNPSDKKSNNIFSKYIIRINSFIKASLGVFKIGRPRLNNWEEFKIFTAGATLATSMIVLGFYLGFNRPISHAENQPLISKNVDGETIVVATNNEGQQVEVSPGIHPNSVDSRPPRPITATMPARLKVSSINVNAPIRSVGLLPNKSLAVPNYLNQVGWYERSAHPGEKGTILLDGHYGSSESWGVFSRLKEVSVGADIEIIRGDGQTITYVVEDKASYDKNATPMDKALASDGKERLSIVTCDGEYKYNEYTYSHRLIVYAVRK